MKCIHICELLELGLAYSNTFQVTCQHLLEVPVYFCVFPSRAGKAFFIRPLPVPGLGSYINEVAHQYVGWRKCFKVDIFESLKNCFNTNRMNLSHLFNIPSTDMYQGLLHSRYCAGCLELNVDDRPKKIVPALREAAIWGGRETPTYVFFLYSLA